MSNSSKAKSDKEAAELGAGTDGAGVNERQIDDKVEDLVVRLAAGEQVQPMRLVNVAREAGLDPDDIRAMAAVREIDDIDAKRRQSEERGTELVTQRSAELRRAETDRDTTISEADQRVETARQMVIAAGLGVDGVWGATPQEIAAKLDNACRLSIQSKSRLQTRKLEVLRRLDQQIAAADATARRMGQLRALFHQQTGMA